MKSLWIGPFTILLANYNHNNYTLDLSTDQSLNLIYKTIHISKINPYVNNNSTLFPQRQQAKPGPVAQERYEVEKVTEYHKVPRIGIQQYKLSWLGYSFEDHQWINAKDLSTRIQQNFWTKGSLENTVKRCHTNNR